MIMFFDSISFKEKRLYMEIVNCDKASLCGVSLTMQKVCLYVEYGAKLKR
jgi:hypothetical protein